MPPVAPADGGHGITLKDPEDDAEVCQWRVDHLIELGLDSVEPSGVRDVHHRVADLIAAGCPPHIAARIVA